MKSIVSAFLFLVCTAGARADFIGHGGMVRAVALSPDGTTVLSAGFDYTLRLWDFSTQGERAALSGHDGPVNAAVFLDGGKSVLSAGNDGKLILWNAADGSRARTLSGHQSRILALAAHPGGGQVASAGWDRTVRAWALPGGDETFRLALDADATAVAYSADGRVLYSGHKDGAIRAWSAADGAPRPVAFRRHDMAVTALAAAGPGRLLSASIDGTVRLWDGDGGTVIHEMKGHDGPVFAVAPRPGADQALSAGRDGRIFVWDLAGGRSVRAIDAHGGPAWSLAATADGRFCLSAGSDGTVRAWHIDTGARIGLPGEGASEAKPWLSSDHPGAKLYRTCAVCHAVSADAGRRSGPHLAGLFGRKAGQVADYPYSPALKDKPITWTDETLFTLFHDGPDVMLPGTKMPVQRVTDAQALRDLIDYLKELTR